MTFLRIPSEIQTGNVLHKTSSVRWGITPEALQIIPVKALGFIQGKNKNPFVYCCIPKFCLLVVKSGIHRLSASCITYISCKIWVISIF